MTDVPPAEAPAIDLAVPEETVAGELEPVEDHIVGMSFDKVTRAEEVLLALVHLQQQGEVLLSDAVVVWKEEGGKVRIRQTVDPTPGRSALSGSIWGMLAGMLFATPVFLATTAVAAGGAALMARLIDLGLDDKWVKEVGNWLDPGSSALLLLVGDDVRPAVVTELGRYEGKVLYCTFPGEVRDELERALSAQA